MENKIILEMKNITKDFSGVKALNDVSLTIKDNEIHALVGENGAGKSTLMKVLSGVYSNDEYEGDIYYADKLCEFKNVRESEDLGIVIIHQELALVPYMTILDNIFLGNEQGKGFVVNQYDSMTRAKELLKMVGLEIDPLTLVQDISVGQQQLVEIAKAFSKNVNLLILDEPTAALNETESSNLLKLIKQFKKEGITSIIISHKLEEIIEISDTITIIRDGQVVDKIEEVNPDVESRIVRSMVGRAISNRFPDKEAEIGEVIFEVNNWNVFHPIDNKRQMLKDVSLDLKAGEIVGIAGLMGSGRTELALSIFGGMYGSNISGQITINGENVDIKSVKDAIEKGLAYVTEDRKGSGLIQIDSVNKNISLSSLDSISKYGIINDHEEVIESEKYRQRLNIRTPSVHQIVENLSGGNQQKVVISKWLMSQPDILILDEPTRGIDVGAKYEIYKLMDEIAKLGKGVIMISSDLPELIGMSDRIYTLCEGEITGIIPREEANEENVMKYMLGLNEKG